LTVSDNQGAAPRKMLADPSTQDDHDFATGRPLHTLVVAAVLIQIVAQQVCGHEIHAFE
jgi:hypothetical protein